MLTLRCCDVGKGLIVVKCKQSEKTLDNSHSRCYANVSKT
jgi:hypothetical protein